MNTNWLAVDFAVFGVLLILGKWPLVIVYLVITFLAHRWFDND